MLRRLRWGALPLVMAGLLVGAPTPVAAAGTGQYQAVTSEMAPSVLQLMQQQVPLADVGNRLDTALRTSSDAYGGVVISAAARDVVLYWRGAETPRIRSLVREANAALGSRGRVLVRAAAYSQAALDREANRLVGTTTGGARVVEAAPMADGSGLEVTVAPQAGASLAARPTVASAVRTTVDIGSAPEPAFGRFNDTSPFNGGADIVNPGVDECSTGFTVINGSEQTFLLTAGHCGPAGTQWRTRFGLQVGTTTLVAPQRDAELIAANAEPFIYNGGPDVTGQGIGESLAGIQSARRTLAGELICQLGAFSGPRCNIQILSHATVNINGVNIQEIKARTRDGSEAIGNGDSGGPVITLGNPGFFIALGINSAEDLSHEVGCVGVIFAGRICSTQMFFNDIADIQPATGTVVMIAPGA